MNRRGVLLCGIFAMLVVAVVSILPPDMKSALYMQGLLHPWLHLTAFALISFLLAVGDSSPRWLLFILLGTILFGLGTEFAEAFLNETPFEIADVFADTVGACLGLLAATLFSRRP